MTPLNLVTTHLGADLDGLAAMVALRHLEPDLALALPGGMDTATARFHAAHGDDLPPLLSRPALTRMLGERPLGALHVVDTSRRDRLGWLGEHVDRFASVRAWDTHPVTAEDLGREVLPAAGSSIAPLVLLLVQRGIVPSTAEAGLFLLGVHADTGHFTFETTTAVDLRAAAQCHAWGAPATWVRTFLPRGLDRRRLRLVSQMAESAETLTLPGPAVTLTRLELDRPEPDLSNLLDELRSAEGWPAAFLLAADPERVSVIGRAGPGFDLRPALRVFGGGGHAGAASASLRGWTLSDVEERLVAALAAGVRTASDLATTSIHGLPADATVQQAADSLHDRRINALPLHEDGAWVGLVTRREVDDALRKGLADAAVGSISTGPPGWVAPDASIAQVRQALLGGQGRLVLVGEDPDATGVITRTTVFRVASADPPLGAGGRPPKPKSLWRRTTEALGPDADRLARLGALAAEHDARTWLVGGSVRDLLLGHTPDDLDVVVAGDALALAAAAAERWGGTVRSHPAFGTATWTPSDGAPLDLARCRAESYPEVAALPRVVPGSLRQDLHRRDFTLNAMAMALAPGELGKLSDPFGGRSDLSHGILRVLHGLSFHDDPTRAIRAARFAARFDLHLAPGTHALLQRALAAGVLDTLGPERTGDAWSKLLREREAVRAVALARDWGVVARLHKSLAGDRDLLERLAATREAWARLTALAPDLEGPDEGPLWLALSWGVPRPDRRPLAPLRRSSPGGSPAFVAGPAHVKDARKALRRTGRASERGQVLAPLTLDELALLVAIGPEGTQEVVETWVRTGRHVRSAVDGSRLLTAGVPEGPAIGVALAAALASARDGDDDDVQLAAALATLSPKD